MPKKRTTLRICDQCQTSFMAAQSEINKGFAKYCSMPCYRLARRISVEAALENYHVDENGCWIYQGSISNLGYAVISGISLGRTGVVQLSRIVMSRHLGTDLGDSSTFACHHCDNRACIRPSHIFPGSNQDNIADRHTKGRTARGDASGRRLHPERYPLHMNAKLTEEQVTTIRLRYAAGGVRQVDLAKEFGVTQTHISQIVLRQSWKKMSDDIPDTHAA